MQSLRRQFDMLRRDRNGSVVLIFALLFPALAMSVGIAVEYGEVAATKAKLQNYVDAAALSAAREMGYGDSSGVTARAEEFASQQADRRTWTVATTASIDAKTSSVTVVQQASRPSMFGSMLPPGGFHIKVSATAVPNSRVPLCVLGSATGGTVVALKDTSSITGSNCLIQSNADMRADGSARVTAKAVRTVGVARGVISPSPVTDAPAVQDPFATLPIDMPTGCKNDKLELDSGVTYLSPGVHCGKVLLTNYAQLILSPGEHYFTKGTFDVQDSAQISGDDVVLIFKGQFDMKFKDNSGLSLEGRKSGIYAGFALITDRSFKGDFKITTDNARKLHGTLYLPNATLRVSGSDNKVADRSPWTVVIAKQIQVEGSANLTINTGYSSSAIPVPAGVGPNSGVRLTN